jgi:hypothetical protein
VATVGERLATLEATARENRDDIQTILQLINGGPSVEWEQSIRGKLHAMRDTQATADALNTAARELRRQRQTQWATWQKIGLFIFSAITATCAIVAALATLL